MTLPPQVAAFLALTGQRLPIVQAPIGLAATHDLVTAVCQAGGLGGLALAGAGPDEAGARVSDLCQAVPGAALFANFALHFPCDGPDATGDVLGACLFAGMGVEEIGRIEGAGDLVTRLWAEVQGALSGRKQERAMA